MGLENKPYFLPAIWFMFAFGSIFVGLRFLVRLRTVGFRGLQGDDFFAFMSEIFFAIDMIVMHCAYLWGTNAEFDEDELSQMTTVQLRTISRGSKITSIGWYTYPMMLWSMKFVMVFFYQRLTKGLWEERLVKPVAALCFLTYVGVFLTVSVSCLPFQRNWQVYPKPGAECAGHIQNIVTNSVCNIVTDVALLSIPIPMLWKLRIPLKQKLITGVFLCSGVFVIIAASIRLAMTYSRNPSTVTMNLWGTLETSSAIVAVNTTMLRPLFTRKFWFGTEPQQDSPKRLFPSLPRIIRKGVYSTNALYTDGTTINTGITTTLCAKEKSTMAGSTVVETQVEGEDGQVLPMMNVLDSDEVFGRTKTHDVSRIQSGHVEKMV